MRDSLSTVHRHRPGGVHLAALEHLQLAAAQVARSLTIWPIVGESLAQRRRRTRIAPLAQALEDGFVSVDAVGAVGGKAAPGNASALRIGNRARDPVLVVFAEELRAERGALVADASVLLPPSSECDIAVHPAAGSRRADQLCRAFSRVERQVGFVAAIDSEIVGLEVMADAALFASCFETLLRPYALDALEAGAARGRVGIALDPLFESPEQFLGALEQSFSVERPTAGLGRGLRLAGPGLAGCALAMGEIVHLAAFPLEVAWAA